MRIFRSPKRDPRRLRYFIYISDAKLDMLFEQIDLGTRKRISAELGLDFKIVNVSVRQADDPAKTRAYKLSAVERFIDTHHVVGSIKEPGSEYFRGTTDMEWGFPVADTVCFRGSDEGRSFCLIGSRRHLMQEDAGAMRSVARSDLAAIYQLWNLKQIRSFILGRRGGIAKYPLQCFEFLAVVLDDKPQLPGIDGNTVLGTPVYVALAPYLVPIGDHRVPDL
jgi:hypothetical protein